MTQNKKSLQELLAKMPPPEWVTEMRRHYSRTGTYRPQDVRRLLGDPERSRELREQAEAVAQNSSLQR